MNTEPQAEHRWLDQLVGEWTCETEARMTPGEPPATFTGTETVRSIGGLWIQAESRSEMPEGGPTIMLITLGFDLQHRRFVGSCAVSMMTHLWIYDGELDDASRMLALDAEGPSMAEDGRMAKYRDVIEIDGADRRVLRSRVLGDDGEWNEFMVARYRRA